jgi:hypothetical protein
MELCLLSAVKLPGEAKQNYLSPECGQPFYLASVRRCWHSTSWYSTIPGANLRGVVATIQVWHGMDGFVRL